MLQKTRELLVLALITVLPFHAFLVTVGTRLLVGAGQAPLPWLAGWKEAILAVVLAVAFHELTQNEKLKMKNEKWCTDMLDWLVIGLLVLGIVTANYKLLTTNSLFGAKYTLFPLLLFLFLRRVSWSERFALLVTRYSLLVGVVVAAYGMLTLLLPQYFFTWLGYSDLHSTYLPDGPLAAFQYLEGTGIRRMQSTFAGPNQLGMWLLIPWSVAVMMCVKHWRCVMVRKIWLSVTRLVLLLVIGTALFLTFSRAAWVGAVVILLVAFWHSFSRYARCWLLVTGFSLLAALVAIGATTRPQSTAEHFRRPLQALQSIAQHPLGLGLGSVGPAANRTGDPCVYLEEGADPSWAADRPNLCVFVGDRQVQPIDRACRCPVLPENWYLQMGVELGVVGLILYVVLVVYVLRSLWAGSGQRAAGSMYALAASRLPLAAFLFFLGISVAALFLHAWEDSAVAYTVWMLVAAALPPRFPSPVGRGPG